MKEAIIQEWFDSWFDSSWDNFSAIFEANVYYSESWGPEYLGIKQIEQWFKRWHKYSKLNKWQISRIIHHDEYSFVEWNFSCVDYEGTHEFDGISMIEWGASKKIIAVKEFASTLPKRQITVSKT